MGQVRIEVDATIELEDLDELTDEDMQALEQDVHDILESEGSNMVAFAQGIVPVRTGNLMASIFNDIDEDALSVILGATADYASFVEYGTYKMTARPFLQPAAETGQETMNLRIEETILDRLNGKLSSQEPGDDLTMEIEGLKLTDVQL